MGGRGFDRESSVSVRTADLPPSCSLNCHRLVAGEGRRDGWDEGPIRRVGPEHDPVPLCSHRSGLS